ncbi:hypothetical protein BH10PSE3_BH10PSE3_07110 [soil metagenome]
MIEVHPKLHVGSESDEQAVRARPGWFFVHACKEPYHRQALGYSGRAAAKDHPEYLIARRPGRVILNLVDVADVNYVAAEIVDAAIEAIHENLGASQVLVHCNQGASRSPTLALLYLAKHTDRFKGMAWGQAEAAFRAIYPPWAPARGMADYARLNWAKYA